MIHALLLVAFAILAALVIPVTFPAVLTYVTARRPASISNGMLAIAFGVIFLVLILGR
jgi:hypothetical protein